MLAFGKLVASFEQCLVVGVDFYDVLQGGEEVLGDELHLFLDVSLLVSCVGGAERKGEVVVGGEPAEELRRSHDPARAPSHPDGISNTMRLGAMLLL